MSGLVEKGARTLRDEGPGRLVSKGLRYPFKPLLVPRASRALQAAAAARPEIEAWVELIRYFNYAGITAESWQIPSEIAGFLRLLEAEPPQTVLEIGTARGGTLFLLTRVAAPEALLVSVDLKHGQFGGGYAAWRGRLYRSFARETQRVELVVGDSHEPRTGRRIRRLLDGRYLDLLFVDGDHTLRRCEAGLRRLRAARPPGRAGGVSRHRSRRAREARRPGRRPQLLARAQGGAPGSDRAGSGLGVGIVRDRAHSYHGETGLMRTFWPAAQAPPTGVSGVGRSADDGLRCEA